MKARNENGTIKVYAILPSKYKSESLNIAGGFYKLSVQIHEQEGFFDLKEPVIDYDIEERGEIYFDDANQIFKHSITPKVLPTLEEAKAQKITQLKSAVKGLYQSIQWYVEMLRADNETIPVAVTDKIKLIRTKYEQIKTEINVLTDVVEVIKYQLPLDAIASLQEQLDNIK